MTTKASAPVAPKPKQNQNRNPHDFALSYYFVAIDIRLADGRHGKHFPISERFLTIEDARNFRSVMGIDDSYIVEATNFCLDASEREQLRSQILGSHNSQT